MRIREENTIKPAKKTAIPTAQPLISKREMGMPGGVQYCIERYARTNDTDEQGAVLYNYHQDQSKSSLQLRFCIAGNVYCNETDCGLCTSGKSFECDDSTNSVDHISITFNRAQLSPFIKASVSTSFYDSLLTFKHPDSFKKEIPVCNKIRDVINGLVQHNYPGNMGHIYVNAHLQMLLLLSLGNLKEQPEMITCRFLANENDIEKVTLARNILLENLGEAITIKELSKKVAMNECYLKKGFKQMYGTTIFDFYQSQRMEHARYLLYEKGMRVTDVSIMLGYSSISHFSTAFKKQTGLKPCELLLR